MLRHLTRTAFIDSIWGAGELNEAADFWVRLYEEAARKGRFGGFAYHAVEVRLQGFPRHQAEAVRAAFAARLKDGDFPDPQLTLADPDTVVFTSGSTPSHRAPIEGLIVPLLAGAPFDGLLVELRFTVAAFRKERVEAAAEGFRVATARPVGRSKAEGTLVLVGELRDGRLHLKAAWRRGPFDDDNQFTLWTARWRDEAAWLAGLETFRQSSEVPRRLAMRCFLSRGSDRVGRNVARLLITPMDRPRLGGLVRRGMLFALVAAPLVALLVRFWGEWSWPTLLLFTLLLTVVGLLGTVFVGYELFLLVYAFRLIRRGYSRLYAAVPRPVAVTPEEAAARLDHPWARKLSGDLAAAGCTHLVDYRLDPPAGGEMVARVYRTGDPGTTVQLMLFTASPAGEKAVQRMWPADAKLLVATRFRDGRRCSTMCGLLYGFRRKVSGPESREQVLPEDTGVEEVLRQHRQMAESFAIERNTTPASLESADDFVRQYQEAIDEDRRLYGTRPYTFGDHLHWWLQIRRREYRG